MTDYKFYGWVGKNKESIGHLVWEEYEPKTWTEDDVDIKISMTTPPLLIVCGNCADLG
jgi:alcohol dehydrogenase (NADP+)